VGTGEAASGLQAGAAGDRTRRSAYERIAPIYDLLDGLYEAVWKRRLRAEAFAGLRGRILDAGVGTGRNMPFYPAGARMLGVDASPAMLAQARARADDLGLDVRLLEMDLLRPRLAESSFDAVVASFMFCCLADEETPSALRTLRRLCRPGGEIRILDYAPPTHPAVRLWTRAMAPWLRVAFAARYDAPIEAAIAPAGLRLKESRSYMGGAVKLLSIETP
jgi:ubiquinone/menaquinone biosynthesis C-methylase UbiE